MSGWDRAAEKYTEEQEFSEFSAVNKKVVAARFRRLNGEKLLDLGCGYGFYTDYFRSVGAEAIGIDGSEKMIEMARMKYPLSDFAVSDITKPLHFADSSFDVVFCNQVLMDIENIDHVFSECSRILKTGGIFYYSIVHPAFYDCDWLKDENGYCCAKSVTKYIEPYHFTQAFWGETEHFHRPMSYYFNIAAKHGFLLKRAEEPVSYDGKTKNKDLPLFLFVENEKL